MITAILIASNLDAMLIASKPTRSIVGKQAFYASEINRPKQCITPNNYSVADGKVSSQLSNEIDSIVSSHICKPLSRNDWQRNINTIASRYPQEYYKTFYAHLKNIVHHNDSNHCIRKKTNCEGAKKAPSYSAVLSRESILDATQNMPNIMPSTVVAQLGNDESKLCQIFCLLVYSTIVSKEATLMMIALFVYAQKVNAISAIYYNTQNNIDILKTIIEKYEQENSKMKE